MARTASNDLHKLIKSLTPAEKRYFKIFSSRHYEANDTNYVKLFDAIAVHKEYDETKIIEKFKEEKFIKKFSIAKARLYESIMRSLDIYHATSSINEKLKRKIHYIEILYKKSLYDQCKKILLSAKRIALKYERYSALLDIYLWEKN